MAHSLLATEAELAEAQRAGEGYFTLDGVELSQAECVALDCIGFHIFVAAHRLHNSGELPRTVHGLVPEQLEILRAEAVALAGNVLTAAARDTLPIEVVAAGSSVVFMLRSHRKAPGPEVLDPDDAPGR